MDKASLNKMVGAYNGRPLESIADRFWSKVNKNGPTVLGMDTPCWIWTAGIGSSGYGGSSVNRNTIPAHRVAWVLERGSILKDRSYHGICILHKCDNRKCVNPDHLFSGSHADNMHDMAAKGRHVSVQQLGEINQNAKLTDTKVLEIRMWLKLSYSQVRIAKAYNVSQPTISLIKHRQQWHHI